MAQSTGSAGGDRPDLQPSDVAGYVERELDRRWDEVARGGAFYRGAWSYDAGARSHRGDVVYGRDWRILLDSRSGRHCRTDDVMGRRWVSCNERDTFAELRASSLPASDVPALGDRARLSLPLSDATRPGSPADRGVIRLRLARTQPTVREALQVWGVLHTRFDSGERVADDNIAAAFDGGTGALRWWLTRPRWEGSTWRADLTAELVRPDPAGAPQADDYWIERTTVASTLSIAPGSLSLSVRAPARVHTQRERCVVLRPGTRTETVECTPTGVGDTLRDFDGPSRQAARCAASTATSRSRGCDAAATARRRRRARRRRGRLPVGPSARARTNRRA